MTSPSKEIDSLCYERIIFLFFLIFYVLRKMYIAYGNALYSERASTNLHLDMSDAVNLLVYVGLPDDCDPRENMKVVLEQVNFFCCIIHIKSTFKLTTIFFYPGLGSRSRVFLAFWLLGWSRSRLRKKKPKPQKICRSLREDAHKKVFFLVVGPIRFYPPYTNGLVVHVTFVHLLLFFW